MVNNNSIFNPKLCWVLYKMVGVSSLSQSNLCIQPMLQSPAETSSSTSVNFHLPIPPLLVHKFIFTIPINTPSLYTSAILRLLLFAYKHPINLHQKYFPTSTILPIQTASRDQGVRESFDDWHCFNLSLLQGMDSENRLPIIDSLSLRL